MMQPSRPPLGNWKLPIDLENIIWGYYPVAWASELLAHKFVKYALVDEEDGPGKYLATPTWEPDVHWMYCSEDLSDDLNPGVYSMVYFIDGFNVDSTHTLTRPLRYPEYLNQSVFGKTIVNRYTNDESSDEEENDFYSDMMNGASATVSRYIGRFI